MHGAAVTLAVQFRALNMRPDIVICSDMLDLGTFTGLLRKELGTIPIASYFHENQISYPWSETDPDIELKRDRHYGFINYTTALIADKVFFNSQYHLKSFIGSLTSFLGAFPDYQNMETVEDISGKSEVLHLGLDLKKLDSYKVGKNLEVPNILWNHRWEYDKNPELFFRTLIRLKEEGVKYKLIVTGKTYAKYPKIFDEARKELSDNIIQWGYESETARYYNLLANASIIPVTSNQDFFGISVIEAIYMGAIPLLPERLAYPEHLSEEQYFYKKDADFYPALKTILTNWKGALDVDLSDSVLRYDWSNMVEEYDKAFEELVRQK